MSDKNDPILIPMVTYTHFATDGKFENMIEAVDQNDDAEHILLCLTEPTLDPSLLDKEDIIDRLARTKKVVAALKKDYQMGASLVLPGILDFAQFDNDATKHLKLLYENAHQTKASAIWVNDTHSTSIDWFCRSSIESFKKSSGHKVSGPKIKALTDGSIPIDRLSDRDIKIQSDWDRFKKNRLNQVARNIFQSVQKHKSIRLGLMSNARHLYPDSFSPVDCAKALAGEKNYLLAQQQSFSQDEKRTAILDTIEILSKHDHNLEEGENYGLIDISQASNFHKSAESMQMQTNLNILFGQQNIIFNGFDETGTAPGSENPFLKMQFNKEDMVAKLHHLISNNPQHSGIRILTPPEKNGRHLISENCSNWAHLSWRMGMPVIFEPANQFSELSKSTVNILSGDVANTLSKKQITTLFQQGVLMDMSAATNLQQNGYSEILGVKVSQPIKNVLVDILSDQSLAAPYYGYRTVMTERFGTKEIRSIKPIAQGARTLTTFQQEGKIPNAPGMSFYDNKESNQLSAILPYDLTQDTLKRLLTPQRQRHFHDLFCLLGGKPLPCFVEASPDLIPFFIQHPIKKRIILALLNISFDWAIDTRIRLGCLPEKIKHVHELNEQGSLETYPDLKIEKQGYYQFLQLNSDTAIPPMQMGLFLLS